MSGSDEMTSYEQQSLKILGNIDEKMDVLMRFIMTDKAVKSLSAQPNRWIDFTQRVRSVLLENGAELKGFLVQQYSAYLKDKYGDDYFSITDDTIKEEWTTYLPSSQGSVVVEKSKRFISEEQKARMRAAAAAMRTKTKAAKAAAGEGGKRKTRRRRA